ncbi:MAG: SDR family NAD(P)-dependent oxidoreductase [SAR202 cluster bacterium]|nr:SDR family NAD(P)-dependent oxidoreductase [SAR202 cluster bacterium]
MAKRVIVTGGAGFIGSHVADALVARGHEVAVLDALNTGERGNVPTKATFYQADITDPAAVRRVFAEVRPHWVDHHAAQISVPESTKDPVADAQANVVGSLAVLEAARETGVEHFVFASTGGALYGDPEKMPSDEETPIAPLAPYGAAKAAVEVYLGMYARTWGMRTLALRYANVYGPRQSPHGEAGVVAIFAARMLSGANSTIFGDGEQQRDFVYVDDVALANVLAFERGLTGSYNVGTGVAASVNEVTRLLVRHAGFGGQVLHAAERPGEVRRIALDASRLRRAVGWEPSVSLDEGLRRTVAFFREKARAGPRSPHA